MQDQRTTWAAIITAMMWIAIIVISAIFMAMDDVSALGAAFFVITMAGIAVGGTAIVWGSMPADSVPASIESGSRSRRKSKRLDPDRLARLMESLDEDQVIELESLLMAQREDMLDN